MWLEIKDHYHWMHYQRLKTHNVLMWCFYLKYRRKRCSTFWWNMASEAVKRQTWDWRWMDWPFTPIILTSYSGLEISPLPDVIVSYITDTSHSHRNRTSVTSVRADSSLFVYSHSYPHSSSKVHRWIWIWECNRKSCHCNILLIIYENLQSSFFFFMHTLMNDLCCFTFSSLFLAICCIWIKK